ncbi:MAG: hypothetical protein AAF449_22865, partial [Myxococcota bacterium]
MPIGHPHLVFPIYAFPPAFAGSVIIGLAVVSLFHGRRDRLSLSFALFCFAWALVAIETFVLQLTASVTVARMAPATVWVTYAFMAGYILVLTGRDRRLSTAVWGIRPDVWLGTIVVMALIAGTVANTTDLVVMGVAENGAWGYSLRVGPAAGFFHLPFVIMISFGLCLLYKARREARSPALGFFLRNNLYALLAIIGSAFIFAGILPLFNIPAFPMVFDAFTIIAFFFFGIIANYQFRQIEELNASLEEKV